MNEGGDLVVSLNDRQVLLPASLIRANSEDVRMSPQRGESTYPKAATRSSVDSTHATPLNGPRFLKSICGAGSIATNCLQMYQSAKANLPFRGASSKQIPAIYQYLQ